MGLIERTIFLARIPLCLFILALPGYIMADENCVGTQIWSDKQEYLPYERIIIGFKITNLSDNILATACGVIDEHFRAVDQDGNIYTSCASSLILRHDSLMPGESCTDSQEIDMQYEIRKPSNYKCLLELPRSFFSPRCPDTVKSNIIEFTIKEPDGPEATVYELYVQTYNEYWGRDKSPQAQELVYRKFLNLAQEFPNSVYAPQSLKYALFGHRNERHSEVASAARDFIENQKDIPDALVDIAIEAIYANNKTIKDKSAAIESMNYLIKKYPDTHISEQAEYWLEKVENGSFDIKWGKPRD